MRAVSQLIAAVALTLFFAGQSAADERSEAIARIDALDTYDFGEALYSFMKSTSVDCRIEFTNNIFPEKDLPPEMIGVLFDIANTPIALRDELMPDLMASMDRAERAVDGLALFDVEFEILEVMDDGLILRQRDCVPSTS